MSAGNKEILIKAAAQALPAYVMSVFKLPASVCDELTRMIRQLVGSGERQEEDGLDEPGKVEIT